MLSIVIPVLNEAPTIEKLLIYLSENSSEENEIEIIVVDGGSIDGTIQIIGKMSGRTQSRPLSIKVISSGKGRARQMNTGEKLASGKIIYFLHADSFPPKDFDKYIISEVEKGNPAGCFRMKFDNNHWWLYLAGWFTQYNLKAFRGGDQSQFITKELFKEIGGFNEKYIIYEDNILISELYKRKKFAVIPHSLTTSARRYEEQGIWNLQYHFWMIHLMRYFGANAEELSAYYKKHIGNRNPKSL